MCVGKITSTLHDEMVRQLLDACGDIKSWKQAQGPETKALYSDVPHQLPVPTRPLTNQEASLQEGCASSQQSSRRRQHAARQPRQGELGQQQQPQQPYAKAGPRSTSAWHQESLDERIERKLRG